MNEQQERDGISAKAWIQLVGAVLVLVLVVVPFVLVLVAAWPTIERLAPWSATVLTITLTLALPIVLVTALVCGVLYMRSHAENKRITARKFAANQNGAYPVFLDERNQRFIQAVNASLPNVVPEHYAPSIHNHNDVNAFAKMLEMGRTHVQEIEAPASPELALPSIEQFYEAIRFNSLQVGMGIEAATGKLVLAPIVKSTHFKLIGGSGMGKSCVSAAMLDIAISTNAPDHLRIGLLDLEHNTSRLFENVEHVAEIGPRRLRLVGRDPDEVAQKLKLLQWELTRRNRLGEEHCRTHEPILLVYVEEMLALKYEVVDTKLNKEMLAAINILGVRARKYGIFLLACMQTDYSDKSTREAMAQFRTRGGFAIDPDTARASGFFNTELVKQNFSDGRSGQYVLEKPGFSGLVLAPEYDVALKLEQLSAPSPAASRSHIQVVSEGAFEMSEGDTEGALEVANISPLRRAPQAERSSFTEQERRFIHKFMQEMGIGQIVSSEFTNAKGEPLTGGEAYKQRSKDVQNVIRRYMDTREVSS